MAKNKARRKDNVVPFETPSKGREINILPKTPNQDRLINAIKEKSLVWAKGYAGTGKTYCAVGLAAQMYKNKEIRKIILARPNVSTGPSLGAFPGDVNEKLWKWLAEPIDVLKDLLGKGAPECMLKKENLVLEPLEVIRGRSWDNAFIFIDEAQNLTSEELKAITTRIGEGSTMVIAGDATQADRRKGTEAGQDFDRIVTLLKQVSKEQPDAFPYLVNGFDAVELGEDDIVRSGIVKDLVKVYNKYGI
ncbi:phosphate starvation-inducible protein [Bacteriophage DSS3_PM1]|nr:phosphate starvation-inducible protein [Bacteriophage DSS3_PM1]